jgi:uncharacterized phage protein
MSGKLKYSQVYNYSLCQVETAVRESCPRCKGQGKKFRDEDYCDICKGKGAVWLSSRGTGWTRPMGAKIERSVLC